MQNVQVTLTDLALTSAEYRRYVLSLIKINKDIKTRLEVGKFGKTLGMIRILCGTLSKKFRF